MGNSVKRNDSMEIQEQPEEQRQQQREEEKNIFNENTIVVISTHGGICTKVKNGVEEFQTFVVPDTIQKIYKFNLAPRGSNSYVSDISYEDIDIIKKPEKSLECVDTSLTNYTNGITKKIAKFQSSRGVDINTTSNEADLYDFMSELQSEFKDYYVGKKSEYPEYNEKISYSSYLNEINGREKMGNKKFVFNMSHDEFGPNPCSWNIAFLNSDNKFEELFKKVSNYIGRKYSHHSNNAIFTSEIIDYLSENGVKNILMFDFSCSSLMISRRDQRRLARDFQIKYGGKHKSKKYKNTKKYKKQKNIKKYKKQNTKKQNTKKQNTKKQKSL
jgi:hypothetical protein